MSNFGRFLFCAFLVALALGAPLGGPRRLARNQTREAYAERILAKYGAAKLAEWNALVDDALANYRANPPKPHPLPTQLPFDTPSDDVNELFNQCFNSYSPAMQNMLLQSEHSSVLDDLRSDIRARQILLKSGTLASNSHKPSFIPLQSDEALYPSHGEFFMDQCSTELLPYYQDDDPASFWGFSTGLNSTIDNCNGSGQKGMQFRAVIVYPDNPIAIKQYQDRYGKPWPIASTFYSNAQNRYLDGSAQAQFGWRGGHVLSPAFPDQMFPMYKFSGGWGAIGGYHRRTCDRFVDLGFICIYYMRVVDEPELLDDIRGFKFRQIMDQVTVAELRRRDTDPNVSKDDFPLKGQIDWDHWVMDSHSDGGGADAIQASPNGEPEYGVTHNPIYDGAILIGYDLSTWSLSNMAKALSNVVLYVYASVEDLAFQMLTWFYMVQNVNKYHVVAQQAGHQSYEFSSLVMANMAIWSGDDAYAPYWFIPGEIPTINFLWRNKGLAYPDALYDHTARYQPMAVALHHWPELSACYRPYFYQPVQRMLDGDLTRITTSMPGNVTWDETTPEWILDNLDSYGSDGSIFYLDYFENLIKGSVLPGSYSSAMFTTTGYNPITQKSITYFKDMQGSLDDIKPVWKYPRSS